MDIKKKKKVLTEGAIGSQFIAESIAQHSTKQNIGAYNIFLGQVRNDMIGRQRVIAIEYIAYKEMAEEKFREIKEEAFAKFNLICMHIYHSIGRVNAGEISLFVLVASAHRQDGMAACKWIVDKIKLRVPIWGKEILEDASCKWKENK